MTRIFRTLLLSAVGALPLVLASAAQAAIPAGYTGTPYMGTPSAIPGRVDLVNVDLGGEGVAYHADHRRSNSAGYEPISGNDYRPDDKDLPNICKTNVANPDSWLEDGAPYPGPGKPEEYYIGYAHGVDWVKVTVDVKQAGKYNVSSTWASEGDKWGLSIWFNDGTGAPDPDRPNDGVNKSGMIEMDGTSDYHKWKKYPNFAMVDLSAGVQVMTFHLENHDHLQYGFLQFDPVGGPIGVGGAGAGGGAAGGASGMPPFEPGGSSGVGGSSSSSSSASGSASGGTGSSSGGSGSTTTPLGTGSTGPNGATSSAASGDEGSCRVSYGSRGGVAAWAALLAGLAMAARRRRSV